MLVLSSENSSYLFSQMSVKVTDNTVVPDEETTSYTQVPNFCLLVPTVQDAGPTNQMDLYYPDELVRYQKTYGKPNCTKYGFGPDLINDLLQMNLNDIGIWTVNLRDENARKANAVVLMKYRVAENEAYTDADGNQYYYDENGQLTTEETTGGKANTPIIRDVMHVKFSTATVAGTVNADGTVSGGITKWTDLITAMNNMATETPDDDGYKTIPVFAVMYNGASTFGNNTYMNLVPKMAEYDGNMYYDITAFDGINTSTASMLSLDINSGAVYNTTYFMETLFNNQFKNLHMVAFDGIEELYELVNKYMYTLNDYIVAPIDEATGKRVITPSKSFTQVDIFNAAEFAFTVDEGSLNVKATAGIKLASGTDGKKTRDELFADFFNAKIVEDVNSVLRYQFNYVPSLGYDANTKLSIVEFIKNRNNFTVGMLEMGSTTGTFESAIVDRQANFYEDMPDIHMIAACQGAMMFNPYIRRTVQYPVGYLDTIALIRNIQGYGNPYNPGAGADFRITGYIEDTMKYAPEKVDLANSLQKNRINVYMKDNREGGYKSDQLMNTLLLSDRTELNNSFIISSMLYDLLYLVHVNHFKFNEAAEVRRFNTNVDETINKKYAEFSASMSCEVYRAGTSGRARYRNKIKVTVDLKDINKQTDVEIVLEDN